MLGECYATGRVVAVNKSRALLMYKTAAVSDTVSATLKLTHLTIRLFDLLCAERLQNVFGPFSHIFEGTRLALN